ncbi:methionine biosynthesis protein MetW [bacterium]|nr:methionine biosynthesis protein MetW [bacterium]
MDNLINYDEIVDIIPNNSRVLDLGSGDGYLLNKLIEEKNVSGVGIEINQDYAISAMQKGLSIIQGDIDEGLRQFGDNSFDFVILNRTLQSTHKPEYVIEEMLRVGKKTLVSFPNFAHWKVRFYLLLKGKMPKSELLPYEWYNTPNIHLLTISDFFDFCARHNIKIEKEIYFTNGLQKSRRNGLFRANKHIANFFSSDAIFVITK